MKFWYRYSDCAELTEMHSTLLTTVLLLQFKQSFSIQLSVHFYMEIYRLSVKTDDDTVELYCKIDNKNLCSICL